MPSIAQTLAPTFGTAGLLFLLALVTVLWLLAEYRGGRRWTEDPANWAKMDAGPVEWVHIGDWEIEVTIADFRPFFQVEATDWHVEALRNMDCDQLARDVETHGARVCELGCHQFAIILADLTGHVVEEGRHEVGVWSLVISRDEEPMALFRGDGCGRLLLLDEGGVVFEGKDES